MTEFGAVLAAAEAAYSELRRTPPADESDPFTKVIDDYMARRPTRDQNEERELVEALDSANETRRGIAAFIATATELERLSLQKGDARNHPETESDMRETERRVFELFHRHSRTVLSPIIARYYGFEHEGIEELEFCRVGTTSVILFDVRRPHQIYKCILPRYMDIQDIRDATASYPGRIEDLRTDPGLHDRIPKAYEARTSRYSKQEYFRGRTLEQYLDRYRTQLHTSENRADLRRYAVQLCDGLCDLLAALGKAKRDEQKHHLDLSPSNVILRDCKGLDFDSEAVCLIDFGMNYLLTPDRIGLYSSYEYARMYVAEEVRRPTPAPGLTSDAYSLGMILLDFLTDPGEKKADSVIVQLIRGAYDAARSLIHREVEPGDAVSPAQSRRVGLSPDNVNESLARLWSDSPNFAAFIEDLTERLPNQRVVMARSPSLTTQFERLKALFRDKATLDQLMPGPAEYEEAVSASRVGQVALSGFALDGFFDLIRARTAVKQEQELLPKKTVRTEGAFALPLLALAVAGGWLAVGAAAIVFTIADFWHGAPGHDFVHWFSTHLPWNHFVPGDWENNLGGRLTAFTFAFIAARYYLNIFSALPFTAIASEFGWRRRAVLRATGIVSPIFCIFGVLYPVYWPVFGALGSIFIVANNWNMWRLARRVRRRLDSRSVFLGERAIGELEVFQHDYREWWLLFGAYGVALALLGGVQIAGAKLDNLWIFAVLVALTNYVKVYRNNCHEKAPWVRGQLARAIDVQRRLQDAVPDVARNAG